MVFSVTATLSGVIRLPATAAGLAAIRDLDPLPRRLGAEALSVLDEHHAICLRLPGRTPVARLAHLHARPGQLAAAIAIQITVTIQCFFDTIAP